MSVILQVKDLNKSWTVGREKQAVLKSVELAVKRGEFVAVMGSSGSGKSTLLYNISGMDQPDSGTVGFDGRQLVGMKEEELSKIRLHSMGFVFQQPNLMKNLGLLDNIILSAYMSGKESRKLAVKRAGELMRHMGIAELMDRDINQVSGGQLQRAAICRALINNPKMLFADEPTGALNASATEDVMDILTDIHMAGTTILLVTHDAKVAARSERVLFMSDGEITAEKKLGACQKGKSDGRQREQELSQWLAEQGF